MRSDPAGRALPQPYLLFLGDITEAPYAKTAFGLRDWAGNLCVGEFALPASTITAGLPRLTPTEAYARGARALVIGVATRGGAVMPAWIPPLREAMEAGLDIISGMHSRLGDNRELAMTASHLGRKLIEVRSPPPNVPIATGRKRSGQRLLTVGTDCALGKKYTALALTRAFRRRGVNADFRATGQTGIMISGAGMPMDAVVADFAAGAAEILSPDAAADHWDIVEGQGSVFHPSYSGVALSLLHGTQPDVLVVCHEVGRERLLGLDSYSTPGLRETIDLHLTLGRRTNPRIRCAGVSLNTRSLTQEQAAQHLAQCSEELQLPVADPMRGGAEMERLVSACLEPTSVRAA